MADVLEPTDIVDYLAYEDADLPNGVVDAASVIIDDVVKRVEDYTALRMGSESVTDTVLIDADTVEVDLARGPVTAISSVTVNGTALAATAYRRERYSVVLVDWYPTISGGQDTLVVAYTGGFAAGGHEYRALQGVIRRRAAMELEKVIDRAVSARRLSVEGYSVDFIPDEWTEGERATLDRHRRRVAAPLTRVLDTQWSGPT